MIDIFPDLSLTLPLTTELSVGLQTTTLTSGIASAEDLSLITAVTDPPVHVCAEATMGRIRKRARSDFVVGCSRFS
jgi:hypothetical protein